VTPYGEKAMVQELEALRAAPEGDRNNALNKAAYTLAQLIVKGHVDEPDLAADLQQAAQAIGLDAREAAQTIKSGIKQGRSIVRGPDPGDAARPAKPKVRPITLPTPPEPTWDPAPTAFAPPDPWQAKARALVDYAQAALFRTPQVTEWLASRGISEITAKAYKLGWLPGDKNGKDLFRPRAAWGLPPEKRDDGSDKPLWIPRGLVIPWIGIDGIHRLRIRRPEGEPRYYVIAGSAMECWMIPRGYPHRAYIIVESELDAIMLDPFVGDLCGIVALGNSTRKPDQRVWAALEQAAIVLLCLDNDPAGQKAMGWYGKRLPRSRAHTAPQGKDPGDAFQQRVNIREWVKAGLPQGWFITQRPTVTRE
jgi:DNA primase